ncbi:MAG: mannose-1-phosphate guanylyltransferase [Candidatus Krumholzibacteria bacterium]|jgi:mannose-1-phosphate guanylyltransferase|nr:mannose-1-phosphate guanylyltransferase [Candidatus Krumholzibacteria bacterium]MDP6669890.1 mannose-1-phosphate guanylyltransferase [Candidatus Krumholzibacteria bacterium]MDP6797630.1 mannose-1-phosphate guanylyltransferase [Candidatus Krumholzibacteria bacterium]MDP7021661.1 mannose-1-phosphate guanylyltransferase [Candidatus Krumholzibacteria bacterium]
MATHLILLAGGKGSRFWPLSRSARPKQLLPLLSEKSLLRETWLRVRPLAPPERIWVIGSRSLESACLKELPELPRENYVGEPVGRNTAAAIALGLARILRRDPRARIAVFPTDHYIADRQEFLALCRSALRETANRSILTLGILPDRPETGYGYIETSSKARGRTARKVLRFREKPSAALARKFLATGKFLWNSGMFFFQGDRMKEAFIEHLPQLWESVEELASEDKDARFRRALQRVYPQLPSHSFDVGIMEKVSGVKVLPARMGWSDVGSWEALGELLPEDEENRGRGEILSLDSRDNVVYSPEGLVALLGVKNLVVVRDGERVLVCDRKRVQELRKLVERLESEGRTEHL